MQKLILAILLGWIVLSGTGCLLPLYSADPVRRNQQLIFASENLRQIYWEWERFWLVDQPVHMTPYQTHGGII
ncbi:MAG: hypothetical protein ACRC10_09260 [Thermoguttaceae bacterium]